MLAGSSVAHLVVKLDIGILGDRDLVRGDREIGIGAARKARSAAGAHGALNDLGSESTLE